MDVNSCIPKIIHYCWFGGKPFPPEIQSCIDTWSRVMPDYRIKCWDENSLDLQSIAFTREALAEKKWSLVSDYVRLYALYTEGGIYFDTDVIVYKGFDRFLEHDFFSAVEYHADFFEAQGKYQLYSDGRPFDSRTYVAGMGLLVALMGAKKGNPFVKELLDFFGSIHFIKPDGTLFLDVIHPAIAAKHLEGYGFVYKNELQRLPGNIVIYPSSVFASSRQTHTPENYAVHCVTGSWRDTRLQRIVRRVRHWFR